MRTLAYQLGFILLGLSACVSLAGSGDRATPLGLSERQRVFGGDKTSPPGCKKTITTCTDKTVPADCTQNGQTQNCWMCSMVVTNYQDCDYTQTKNPPCTSTTTTAYCGAVYAGTTLMGSCDSRCTIRSDIGCGLQIPTVTGVPCSP
jgi:hypothetical protein